MSHRPLWQNARRISVNILSSLVASNELVRSGPHLIQDSPARHFDQFSHFYRAQMLCYTMPLPVGIWNLINRWFPGPQDPPSQTAISNSLAVFGGFMNVTNRHTDISRFLTAAVCVCCCGLVSSCWCCYYCRNNGWQHLACRQLWVVLYQQHDIMAWHSNKPKIKRNQILEWS